MKAELKLEMTDVYGGDGIVRLKKLEKITLARKKKKTTTGSQIGVAFDRESSEVQTDVVDEKINTFRVMDGFPVLRLGGAHGKLWGAMRATGKQLADIGEFDSKAFVDRIMNMLSINPVFVPVTDGGFSEWIDEIKDEIMKPEDISKSNGHFRIDSIFQKMGGGFGTALPLYYDVIEKSIVDLTLTYPEQLSKQVKKLVYGLESGSHMNKMRTMLKILSFKEIKEKPN